MPFVDGLEIGEVLVGAAAVAVGGATNDKSSEPLLNGRMVRSDIEANEEEEDEIRARAQRQGCITRCMTSACGRILFRLFRFVSGVLGAGLFYADLASDLLLMGALYRTGNPIWASMTLSFIVLQYLAAWFGVLCYLRSVFGADSRYHRLWAFLGFPLGPIFLDVVMFLEPLGMLWLIPSAQLRYLLPAYKATRCLIEVTCEGLPQAVLQAYIFYRLEYSGDPQASALSGVSLDLLVRSLLLSLTAFILAWVSAVLGARVRSMSMKQYLTLQLQMGAGLPIDALNRGAISEWTCPFALDPEQVKQLCTALRKNSSLTHLDLQAASAAGLTLDDGKALALAVRQMRQLRTLNLDGLELHVDELTGAVDNEKARVLDLRGQPFSPASGVVIAQFLAVNPRLTAIYVNGNALLDGGSALADGIEACMRQPHAVLATVDVGECGVSREVAMRIGAALRSGAVGYLGLANCKLSEKDGVYLADMVKSKRSLHTLLLPSNPKLGPGAAKALGDVLKVATESLAHLHLAGSGLGVEGCKSIANAVKFSNVLSTLDLASNGGGPHFAKPLAMSVKGCASLTALRLRANGMGTDAAKELAKAIAIHHRLTEVDLAKNAIGDGAADALALALRAPKMRYLDLGANDFSAVGLKALSDGLKRSSTLSRFSLKDNSSPISKESSAELAEALKGCDQLDELNLEGCKLGKEGKAALAKAKRDALTLLM